MAKKPSKIKISGRVGQQPGPEGTGSSEQSRREGLSFPGFDPYTKKIRTIALDHHKLRLTTELGIGKVKEAGFNVREVLATPTHVFEGFLYEEDHSPRGEGWMCFVGKPKYCYEDDGEMVLSPPDEVFLVFVTEDWIAYNWYWNKADDRGLPDDHKLRFRRLI